MATSIFARNLAAQLQYDPNRFYVNEVAHLKGQGQSRWRTNPFMATCRTVGGFVFLAVLILYFMDPFRFAVQKTQAINAYLYLYRFGNPSDVEPLRTSGMFTDRDWRKLKMRGQYADSDSAKVYFVSTLEAKEKVQETVDFMRECEDMTRGQLSADASPLATVRFYLFRKIGIIPPREWMSLNPVIGTDE